MQCSFKMSFQQHKTLQQLNKKKLALHSCCAPCLIGSLQALENLNHSDENDATCLQVTAVFYNPNIEPSKEYDERLAAFIDYVDTYKIDHIITDPLAEDKSPIQSSPCLEKLSRCEACYLDRLDTVARFAASSNFDYFATTLSISPWQDLKAINQLGLRVENDYEGLCFLPCDFRDFYNDAQRQARTLGIYCQNYCGCIPSKKEAQELRAERKAARKAAKHRPKKQYIGQK